MKSDFPSSRFSMEGAEKLTWLIAQFVEKRSRRWVDLSGSPLRPQNCQFFQTRISVWSPMLPKLDFFVFFSYESLVKNSGTALDLDFFCVFSRIGVISYLLANTCHSVSAKPSGNCCQKKRTSQVPIRIGMSLNKHWTLYLTMNYMIWCNWYLVSTYPCLVNVCYVINTYCLRILPVYWSRLGRNRYRKNGYSLIFLLAHL